MSKQISMVNTSRSTVLNPAGKKVEPKKRNLNPFLAWGFKIIQKLELQIKKASIYGDHPFFDTADFPWVEELEKNLPVIRKEMDAILSHKEAIPNFQQISKDQEAITKDDRWKTFFLYGYGYKAEKNCARCPETTKLVEQVPNMLTAFFSILAPGKHIPDHRGPYNGVLRYHMGIKVPQPNEKCRIRVDKEYRHWEEGKSMIFDDTYRHEAWNDTDGYRVILFMDIIRPVTFPTSLLNSFLIKAIKYSSFVQNARKNQDKFDMSFEATLNGIK